VAVDQKNRRTFVRVALAAQQTNNNDGQDYDKSGRCHGHDQVQVAQHQVQNVIVLVRQFTCWRDRSCNIFPPFLARFLILRLPKHNKKQPALELCLN
jgi:hypothetical protein